MPTTALSLASELLEAVINAKSDEERQRACLVLRDRVVEAVSVAEGVRNPKLRRSYLALRVSRIKDAPIRSYRLFPKDSFRIAWTERRYQDGSLIERSRWSAIVTVTLQPPRTPDAITKNPLGLFVTAINWSKELSQ